MTFPWNLNAVTVTGLFADAAGNPLIGNVVFQPVVIPVGGTSAEPVIVTDAAGHVVIGSQGVVLPLQPVQPPWAPRLQPGQQYPPQPVAVSLVATDNASLAPQNWCYQVTLVTGSQAPDSFTCLLPHSPGTVDFSQLVNSPAGAAIYGYLTTGGGTMTGTIVLDGDPPLQIEGTTIAVPPGGTADYLRADGTWDAPPGESLSAGTGLTLSGTTMSLNTPVEAGFLPAATTDAQGVIGPLPGGSTEFLRADGTWAVPPAAPITEIDGGSA